MAVLGFDQLIEQQHLEVDAFAKGDDEPLAALWSRADDVTLGNPFGPFVRGFEQVAETMKRAAANYRDGEAIGFEQIARHVADDVAYVEDRPLLCYVASRLGLHPVLNRNAAETREKLAALGLIL